ncbi:MAG TPA: transporter substrate-binding domain-containing protein [Ramlibacter sp.]|nr:transporter substrate-binding domain-containing protein [Ramlibacter sp.]
MRFLTRRMCLASGLAALLPACGDFPRDAEDTLKSIRAGRPLRVGWSVAAPWVRAGAPEPGGLEPDLVRAFAATLGARIEWRQASQEQLVEAVQQHAIDLLVAGLEESLPWSGRVGTTQPYVEYAGRKRVIALPPSENALALALDRFLHERKAWIWARLQEEVQR